MGGVIGPLTSTTVGEGQMLTHMEGITGPLTSTTVGEWGNPNPWEGSPAPLRQQRWVRGDANPYGRVHRPPYVNNGG
jgi:hypothetical protein